MGKTCGFWVFYRLHFEAKASGWIQHSARKKTDKHIQSYTALSCPWFQVCWVSPAGEPLWILSNATKSKNKLYRLTLFLCFLNSLFTSTLTPGTLYTVKVIALFLHILWDAGCGTHSYQILQDNISESIEVNCTDNKDKYQKRQHKTNLFLDYTRGRHKPLNLILFRSTQHILVWHFWYACELCRSASVCWMRNTTTERFWTNVLTACRRSASVAVWCDKEYF